jgi:hypothetical protein
MSQEGKAHIVPTFLEGQVSAELISCYFAWAMAIFARFVHASVTWFKNRFYTRSHSNIPYLANPDLQTIKAVPNDRGPIVRGATYSDVAIPSDRFIPQTRSLLHSFRVITLNGETGGNVVEALVLF